MAYEAGAVVERAAGAVLARDRALPLAAALAPLFPTGGLQRGATVSVGAGPGGAPGATSLALALLSAPSAGGSWCAVVGVPELGFVAADQLGADLGHLVLVPTAGQKWPVVVGALLEGLDLVVLRLAAEPRPAAARRLAARAREQGAVLVVMGAAWPGVDVRLQVVATRWRGLQCGHGYLWGREMEVVASGRGAASRERRVQLSLGAGDLGTGGLGTGGLLPMAAPPQPPVPRPLAAGGPTGLAS